MKTSAKRGASWVQFCVLMSFIAVLIILITFFIYQNAISAMEDEINNANMNQASQLENNMVQLIEQTERLASGICIQQESLMFWGIENPNMVDTNFYTELGAMLKSYSYSMGDFISSIVLYSPLYHRIIQEGLNLPYVPKSGEINMTYNYAWIDYLEDVEKGVHTQSVYRAVNDSYPYVLTMIKQFSYSNGWGAVAIDMNLEKVYYALWPEKIKGTTVWVLNEEGKVIIRDDKNELFASRESFEELKFFQETKDEISLLWKNGEVPVSYVQRYLEEYGLYFVVVSELEDFQKQMQDVRFEAFGIGFLCVLIACLMVWIYVNVANKPLQSILSMLRDPVNCHTYMTPNSREVQEIVDRIISNIQMNDTLREELEKRMDILRQTQLQALKAQINPHFLFNTLNVIVMLIDAEVEDSVAAQVTADLAAVLHYALSDEDLVLLSKELEHTRKFIFILEQRYKGRFRTQIDIEPELLKVKVPKLTLQPLIENAVFHGIAPKHMMKGGLLSITGRKVRDLFGEEESWAARIDVADNGKGMLQEEIDKVMISLAEERVSMNHIGVQNVAKRLALLFPQKSRLEIQSKSGEGTCISLFFPFEQIKE